MCLIMLGKNVSEHNSFLGEPAFSIISEIIYFKGVYFILTNSVSNLFCRRIKTDEWEFYELSHCRL